MSAENPDAVDRALRRFDHLASLGDEALSNIATQVSVHQARPGDCLLELGSDDERLLYLVEGELELLAIDGALRRVRHTDTAASGPVSRLRPSRYRVAAVGNVRYLLIDRSLIDSLTPDQGFDALRVEEATLRVDADSADSAAAHPLMTDVLEDINTGVVYVPCEPGIAASAATAIRDAAGEPNRLARLLAVFPTLALRALRASRDRRGAPAVNLREAVNHLGGPAITDLAVRSVLCESLHAPGDDTRHAMAAWWERTLRVAAGCVAIARSSERFDPEFAQLLGLVHGFGEPVLLRHAGRYGSLRDDVGLRRVVRFNRVQVARIMAVLWDLPKPVVETVTQVNNWHFDHAGDNDYTDIVLAAQWFVDRDNDVPDSAEVPALQRLGLQRPAAGVLSRIDKAVQAAVPGAMAELG